MDRLQNLGLKYKIFLFALAYIILLSSCSKPSNRILVEAESFKAKGGWVVDPQFVEQMGSPYLLAHGLGVPVKNASTEIKIQYKGKYFVWVRTRNWAKGNWEAPGRFKLIINGRDLETVLGTDADWDWQFGGCGWWNCWMCCFNCSC
jgi:hypothetical protein